MSILIRGMEMPKSCFYCPMRWKVDPDNIKCLATGEVFEETFTATIEMRNAGNCPLVEIPPHGRPVVLCRDCVHARRYTSKIKCGYWSEQTASEIVCEDDFCSYGEKRKDGVDPWIAFGDMTEE